MEFNSGFKGLTTRLFPLPCTLLRLVTHVDDSPYYHIQGPSGKYPAILNISRIVRVALM